ncbi:MAG: tetratricopeptide repeat protein [Nitrospirota bacterium]
MSAPGSPGIVPRSRVALALVVAWALAASGCGVFGSLRVVAFHDPLSADEHVALGVAYERDGNPERAAGEYKAALRTEPNHAQALVNLGNLAAAAGDSVAAEGWYGRAVRVGGPSAAPGANNLAWVYLSQGKRVASAESLARKAMAWDPRPEYADTLVAVLIKLGKPLEAGRAIDDASAQWKDDAPNLSKLRETLADDLPQLASLALEQGKARLAARKYDDAERLAREAVRRDRDRAADSLFVLVHVMLETARPEEAVRLIDEAQSASPADFAAKASDFARSAHGKSRLLFQEGALNPAELLVRGALRWDPSRAPYYLDTLAQVLIAQDKPYEAGRVIDEAEALVPVGDPELRARLFDRKAELFASKGLAAEAKAAAQQAESIRKAAAPP